MLAGVLLAMALALPALAGPTTPEFLTWLESRRQLWVQEMRRMESHEHGQYKVEYHQLAARMAKVSEQAKALKNAKGTDQEKLREQLYLNVAEVEQGLEFLLSETPELAEKVGPEATQPLPR